MIFELFITAKHSNSLNHTNVFSKNRQFVILGEFFIKGIIHDGN